MLLPRAMFLLKPGRIQDPPALWGGRPRLGGEEAVALWLLFLLALTFATFARAATPAFPPLTGRVVDAANVLPPETQAALTAKLAALETSTGTQLVVATIPKLGDVPIEDYGYQLGRAWGVGQKGKNSGAILLIAPNDRKVRIEVGYGLEPVLTDALTSVIIQNQILPAFRSGDIPGGVVAGTDALIQQLQLSPDAAAAAAAAAAQAAQLQRQQAHHASAGGGSGFTVVLIILFILFSLFRRRSGYGGGGGGLGTGLILGSLLGGLGRGGGGGGDWGGGGSGGGGGFSGGGGSFGGGGSSGSW